jgi:hypothetical protein
MIDSYFEGVVLVQVFQVIAEVQHFFVRYYDGSPLLENNGINGSPNMDAVICAVAYLDQSIRHTNWWLAMRFAVLTSPIAINTR